MHIKLFLDVCCIKDFKISIVLLLEQGLDQSIYFYFESSIWRHLAQLKHICSSSEKIPALVDSRSAVSLLNSEF